MEKQKHSDYNSSFSLYTAPFWVFLNQPNAEYSCFFNHHSLANSMFLFFYSGFFFIVWLQIDLLNCTRYRSSKRCRRGKWLSVSNTKLPSKTLAPPASSDWCIRILNLCYLFVKSRFRVEIFMEFRCFLCRLKKSSFSSPTILPPTTSSMWSSDL